jgi:hypothetical protein
MISFKNVLNVEDAEAIRSFLTKRANELKRNPPAARGRGGPGGTAPAGPPPSAVGTSAPPAHQ